MADCGPECQACHPPDVVAKAEVIAAWPTEVKLGVAALMIKEILDMIEDPEERKRCAQAVINFHKRDQR